MAAPDAFARATAMKWYPFHIGDYARRTRGLTWQQHGLYRALIDEYFANEAPLTGSVEAIAEAIGTATIDEVKDVEFLLRRFFVHKDDAYTLAHADALIGEYQEKAPAREQKKANARERRDRYNLARATLFQLLRDHGAQIPFNTSLTKLRDLAARMQLVVPEQRTVASAQIGVAQTPRQDAQEIASGRVTTDRHNQEPITSKDDTQSSLARPDASAPSAADDGRADVRVSAEKDGQTAAAVAETARRFGIGYTNARDAKLLALLQDGCTLADFENACAITQARGKGWAFMLGVVEQRRKDQAREQPREGPKSGDRAANAEWLRGLEALIGANAKNGGSGGH